MELSSAHWYRVAKVKPRLRSDAQVHRHVYRGAVLYVLQDGISRQLHCFNAAAYRLIGLMDGCRTVDQVWIMACEELGEQAPTQDDVIRVLATLHATGVLQSDLSPDTAELLHRARRIRQRRLLQYFLNPLSLRIPLFNPTALLARLAPWTPWVFSPVVAVLWSLAVMSAAVLTVLHWSELTQDGLSQILAPQNLLIAGLLYPLIKALHELGHALVLQRYGAAVPEVGVMLLLFLPIPYVEASAAAAFRDKYARMHVDFAGIAVELFLASIALFVWIASGPGLVHAIAYNTVWIAGIGTVLFNGNPLLRYDGYYLLADWIEIPNLAQRASRYARRAWDRWIFGVKEEGASLTLPRERGWLVMYGALSTPYRLFVSASLILTIAQRYFGVGLLLAVWGAAVLLVWPAYQFVRETLVSAQYAKLRRRVRLSWAAILATCAAILCLIPIPLSTTATAVIWPSEDGIVRALQAGFLTAVLRPSGSLVRAGEAIAQLDDPELAAQREELKARIAEMDARGRADASEDRVLTGIDAERRRALQAELVEVRTRLDHLTLRARATGRLIIPGEQDLPGQFIRRGRELAYVMEEGVTQVRALIPETAISLIRARPEDIEARVVEDPGHTWPAHLIRLLPAGSRQIPNAALTTLGGGDILVDVRDRDALLSVDDYFQAELTLSEDSPHSLGERAIVRFHHGFEPLGWRLYRQVRTVLIRDFRV